MNTIYATGQRAFRMASGDVATSALCSGGGGMASGLGWFGVRINDGPWLPVSGEYMTQLRLWRALEQCDSVQDVVAYIVWGDP